MPDFEETPRGRRRTPFRWQRRMAAAACCLVAWIAAGADHAATHGAVSRGGRAPRPGTENAETGVTAAPDRTSGPAAQPDRAKDRRILPDYTTITLANGLMLLIMEQRELPLVSFKVIVRAGSSLDPAGREGLAALTAGLLRQGTAAMSATEFSGAVDFLGGHLEASADHDKSSISGEFLSRDFRKGLDLLAEMIRTPAFRAEEIERARAQTLASIRQALDDPATIADKQFARHLYGDHPYARPVEGSEESVRAIDREGIVKFYAAHWSPANAIVAIVGDIETDRAIAAAKETLRGWAGKPPPRAAAPGAPRVQGKRVIVIDKPDVNQTQIRLGTIGIRRGDARYFPTQLMATILGGSFTSWLNQEIREKRGLSYGASCRSSPRLLPGPLVVGTFTKNETTGETIRVALSTLARFRAGEFTAADLGKAQNYRSGQYPLTVETTDRLAEEIADLAFYGQKRDFVDRQIERIRAVRLEDLRAVASLLPVEDYLLLVVTNAAAVRPQLEGLGKIQVVPYTASP